MGSTFDEEVRDVSRYIVDINNAMSRESKIPLLKGLFTYMLNSRFLLINKRILDMIKVKMNEIYDMSKDYPGVYDEIMGIIFQLCEKVRAYEPDAEEMSICKEGVLRLADGEYKIVGAGSYGAVIKPALPNVVNNETVHYPTNVTKLFFEEDAMDHVLNIASKLPKLMGKNEGHSIYKYVKTYKVADLPAGIFNKLKEELPYLKNSDALYLVRMPNLGIDISKIDDPTVYKEIRKRHPLVILEQIQKLLNQTANLARNDYIHGDIRPPNVMVNPSTGILTIVDFDWLYPIDAFVDDYSFGFYSNPPEYLVMNNREIFYGKGPFTQETLRTFTPRKKLNEYINVNIRHFPNTYGSMTPAQFEKKIMEANFSNVSYIKDMMDKNGLISGVIGYINYSIKTLDNYGLGLTLLHLLHYLYPPIFGQYSDSAVEGLASRLGGGYSKKEVSAIFKAFQKVVVLLRRISSMLLSERPSPERAEKEIDGIVEEFKEELEEGKKVKREVERLAVLMGDLSVLRRGEEVNGVARKAISSSARRELNRARVLAGEKLSAKSSTRSAKKSSSRSRSRKVRSVS